MQWISRQPLLSYCLVPTHLHSLFLCCTGVKRDPRCVWCSSLQGMGVALLGCSTCHRCFCFRCYQQRAGYGVNNWSRAVKNMGERWLSCNEVLQQTAIPRSLKPLSRCKCLPSLGSVSNSIPYLIVLQTGSAGTARAWSLMTTRVQPTL
jgi:hypothetical protein